MTDKMMRIAGRNENGQAEALRVNSNGILKTAKPTYKRVDIDFGSIAPGEVERVQIRPEENTSLSVKHIVLDVPTNQNGNVSFGWRLGADSFYDDLLRLEGEQLRLTPHGILRGEIVYPNEFSPTKAVQLQQYIQQIAYISYDAFSYFELQNNTTATISGVTCRIFVEEI